MDLQEFRRIVDSAPPGIRLCENDPVNLYAYVGLDIGAGYRHGDVGKALYDRIQSCFVKGHGEVWHTCRSVRTDLIRDHVLNQTPLDPYFAVLGALCDAVRIGCDARSAIDGDWEAAVRAAVDSAAFNPLPDGGRERTHAREFEVAKAARFLRDNGFPINIRPGWISLEEESERRAIAAVEALVADIGGLNVARRIFAAIAPVYDPVQQRYHLTPSISMTGGGKPQIPWGYLIQLAAKHLTSSRSKRHLDQLWGQLLTLAQAVGALFDVQPYSVSAFGQMDAIALVPYLQNLALYDSLFRMPQLRASDVDRIIRGVLDWYDFDAKRPSGWTLNDVLQITAYLLDPVRDARGPVLFREADIRRGCPTVPRNAVTVILDQVLSHSNSGANRNYSHPSDAPRPDDPATKGVGADFSMRPLLHLSGRTFVLLDRAVCAPAFLEAVLSALRTEDRAIDDKVGAAMERFLATEFDTHNIRTSAGDYDVTGAHGECDLVIESASEVIFLELKKKALTRTARTGNDASLLIDLAGSLLAAQVQAGWHEVRLRQDEWLDLEANGSVHRVQLDGRGVERLAVSLLDYGSFQDRILLKQFLEASLNASFAPTLPLHRKKFDALNSDLRAIRDQVAALTPNGEPPRFPFFNCWFLSVPQILLLLDEANDVEDFKRALWSTRYTTTGRSDFYADLSYMKGLKAAASAA